MLFLPDDSPQWRCQQRLPDGSPHWHFRPQLLPDAAASSLVEHLPPSGNLLRTDFRCSAPASQQLRRSAPASSISATAASLASSVFLMALRLSAPASNKPHPAEKSTPVWLAIWRTWARFANSQHRDAAFATLDNICAHSSLLQH